MQQPKFSEVLRAAAKGLMAPYDPPPGATVWSFDGRAYDQAKQHAAMFNAIAELYETYEKASVEQCKHPQGFPCSCGVNSPPSAEH